MNEIDLTTTDGLIAHHRTLPDANLENISRRPVWNEDSAERGWHHALGDCFQLRKQYEAAVALLRDLYDHPNGINQDRVRAFLATLASQA
jgi:hypothetical protein